MAVMKPPGALRLRESNRMLSWISTSPPGRWIANRSKFTRFLTIRMCKLYKIEQYAKFQEKKILLTALWRPVSSASWGTCPSSCFSCDREINGAVVLLVRIGMYPICFRTFLTLGHVMASVNLIETENLLDRVSGLSMEGHLLMLVHAGRHLFPHGLGPFPRQGVPTSIKGDDLLSFLPFLCLVLGCDVTNSPELLPL